MAEWAYPKLDRFLVVELIHPDLNHIFDMCVVFITNYFFNGMRRLHRQRGALGDRLNKSQDLSWFGLSEVLIWIECVYIYL
jgi:hypothetical protein